MIAQNIKEHLSKDGILKKIMNQVALHPPKPNTDLYLNLLRAIAGQQLSVKAAGTIWERTLNLFPERYPKTEMVLQIDVEAFRGAGLSYQKAGYLKNIALFSLDNSLDYKILNKMSDAELIHYLTQIKGVGSWTAEMILIFSLVREDIFPVADLGIQNAIRKHYKLESSGKQLKAEMTEISKLSNPTTVGEKIAHQIAV